MKALAPLAPLALLLVLAGCGLSMDQQRRYSTYAPAKLFEDGTAAQPLPAHVVAQGDLKRDHEAANPPPVTPVLLRRGRERYDIYCTPCHGLDGQGEGMAVKRGFPRPPSFTSHKLLQAKAKDIYDTITHGYGVMYSFAAPIDPRDRWAIVAYVRALQLAQHATLAQAPEATERLP